MSNDRLIIRTPMGEINIDIGEAGSNSPLQHGKVSDLLIKDLADEMRKDIDNQIIEDIKMKSSDDKATALVDLVARAKEVTCGLAQRQTLQAIVNDLAQAEPVAVPEAKASSRWVLLKAVSNSGCNLFSCTICGRVSKSPDKRCAEVEKDCFGKVFRCEDQ
jgi:hypothetical protein